MASLFRRAVPATALVLTALACLGTTVVPLEFDQLVDRSDRVIRGTVVKTRCEWRTHEDSRFIVTIVTVRVAETMVGPAESVVELQFLGGSLEGRSLNIAGQPHFRAGDEDILFVTGNGQSICPLVGMHYGRILVVPQANGRSVVARANGAPIRALAELGTPINEVGSTQAMRALAGDSVVSADDFCAAIRQRALGQGRTDVEVQ